MQDIYLNAGIQKNVKKGGDGEKIEFMIFVKQEQLKCFNYILCT